MIPRDKFEASVMGHSEHLVSDTSGRLVRATIGQLKKANELVTEIEKAERLISAYREAERVVVGIPSTRAPDNEAKVTLAAEEIANAIIAALERRIAKSKESLRELAPPAAGDS